MRVTDPMALGSTRATDARGLPAFTVLEISTLYKESADDEEGSRQNRLAEDDRFAGILRNQQENFAQILKSNQDQFVDTVSN